MPIPPRVRCQQSRDVTCRERVTRGARSRRLRSPSSTWPSWATSSRATGGEPADRPVGPESIRDDLWETSQLAFWGVLFSGVVAVSRRRVLGAAASTRRRLPLHGPRVRRHRDADVLVRPARDPVPGPSSSSSWFSSSEPFFYSIPNPVGSGPTGVLPATSRCRCSCSPCSSSPDGAATSARRCSTCCTATTSARRARRGCRDAQVVWKHGLRNSLSPLVTVIALDFGALFGGLIITERVFSRPGMGTLLLERARTTATPRSSLPWMLVDRGVHHRVQPVRRRAVRRARSAGPADMSDPIAHDSAATSASREPATAAAVSTSAVPSTAAVETGEEIIDAAPVAIELATRSPPVLPPQGSRSRRSSCCSSSCALAAFASVVSPYDFNPHADARAARRGAAAAVVGPPVRHRQARPRPADARALRAARTRCRSGSAWRVLSVAIGVAVGAIAGYYGGLDRRSC